MDGPLWTWSATDTASAIRDRRVSAEEAVSAQVDRMRAANPAVNAVVVDMGDEALAAARAADARQAAGEAIGPLHGVPVTIKENVDMTGRPTPNGVPALADLIAPDDSPVVRNLHEAGAICIGRTNTPEFSFRVFTENPLHGLTKNPWGDDVSCGGSSGGAASATALGIGCIGHGNDLGGSLRQPAHCCGLATIRPTLGRVPAFNPSLAGERPFFSQLFSVQGPLAREVADVRLGLAAMARGDARDPNWVPAPLEFPSTGGAPRAALARLPEGIEADPRVMALVSGAADHLADAGWAVEEAEAPDVTGAWKLWANLLINEVDALQAGAMMAAASDDLRVVWRRFMGFSDRLDLKGFLGAAAERVTRLREWSLFLDRHGVLLTPVMLAPTPPHGVDAGPDDAAASRLWLNDMVFIAPFNMLGLPAAVVPAGLLDGRPVGVQIVAPRFREDLALAAAEAIEARVGVLARSLWARDGDL